MGICHASVRIFLVVAIVCLLLLYGFWGHLQSPSTHRTLNGTYDRIQALIEQQNVLLAKYEAKLLLLSNLDGAKSVSVYSPINQTSSPVKQSEVPFKQLEVPFVASASPDAKTALLFEIVTVTSSSLQMTAKFAVVQTDSFVGAAFRSGRWWEDTSILLILTTFDKHPAKYCNILDLGVNMGSHTVAYGMHLLKHSSRYSERCTVFGFEPQPAMFLAAITNVGLNGLGNVQLFNAATVHTDGQSVTMGAKEDYGASVSFTDKARRINFGGVSLGSGGVAAPGLKIDSLGFERVGLIKADIQGSEPMAFFGAQQLIKRDKPLLFFETGFAKPEKMKEIVNAVKPGPVPTEASTFDLWKFCEPLGYTKRRLGDDVLLIPPPA